MKLMALVREWREDAARLERESHKAVRVDEWTLARAEARRDCADQLEAALREQAADMQPRIDAWERAEQVAANEADRRAFAARAAEARKCARDLLAEEGGE